MTDLKPRTASVVIYQGDDLERLSELRREADIAERELEVGATSLARVGDDDKVTPAQVAEKRLAYNAYVDEAAERAIIVTVEAMKRTPFRALMAEHGAREKNDEDEAFGVNMDAFPEPFLRESVVKVEIGDRELNLGQIRDLLDALPEGDFDRVFSTAYMLNRAPGGDPKESRYSTASPSSVETSTSPSRLG